MARSAARALNGEPDGEDTETASVQLLADIRDSFETQGDDVEQAESAVLVAYLMSLETRPWPEWRAGNALNANGLSRLLGAYDIRPASMRASDAEGLSAATTSWTRGGAICPARPATPATLQ
jgi:Protein of unknown function (DUF3631)